ncbi:ABC transporter substrate-binding protein [Thioalkalivibrio sp. ALE17]|uniref:ABC transporter substrate-binding protein n=1 Tax=Thioalkalivibrio sp. ALE17 TaxID=1158173 RepID=UPI0021010B60|nr:ABC transporter substrate-binding protein [Thioalkalivibrio sp. ALE17]
MGSVRLGLMPPLTGLVSIYGTEILRAAEIACAEINEQGGVLGRPLELVVEDDGSLPESAVAAAEKLVKQHGCAAIIGNLLSNSRIAVAYRVAEPNRVPQLNFSFHEGSIDSRYFFHFAALPNQQIDRMIPYMREQYGPRFFFAGNNYEWPRGSIAAAKDALAKCGGESLGEEYRDLGVAVEEIDRLLDVVAAAAPDVFVPYFAGADQINLLTRFSERGLKSGIAVVMGHYDEMMASKLPPEVREGLYSSNTYFMSVDSDANRDFMERLAQMPDVNGIWPHGNGTVTNFSEGAYVCVKAFATAANAAGSTDSEALVDALKTVRVTAPQGSVVMDPETQHAAVNCYLTRCNREGVFDIIQAFELQPPVIPERYRHQKISSHATLEDDIRLQARMLEQMQGGVLLIDSGSQAVIYANAGAEKMFGYERGGLVNTPWQQLGPPGRESGASRLEDVATSILQHGAWEGELRQRHQNGTELDCMVSFSTFTHPVQGEVWLAVYTDITDRKQAERKLRESEQRFRDATQQLTLATEAAQLGVWDLNLTSGRLDWDSGMFRLYGVLPRDFGHHADDWRRALLPEDVEHAEASLETILERPGTPREFTFRILRGDGATRHIRAMAQAITDAAGVVVRAIGVNEDVTERIEAERALAEQALRTQTIIDNIVDGIITIDRDGLIQSFNPGASRIFGYMPREVAGRNVSVLMTGPDRESHDVYLRNYQATGNRRVIGTSRELQGRRKDGTVFPMELAVSEVTQHGEPLYVGVVRDITERKRVERMKNEFVSTVSHELRTPLTSISGALGMIASGALGELPGKVGEMVTIAQRNSQRLTLLINDLLDMEKIAAGKLHFDMRAERLEPLLEQALESYRGYAEQHQVQLVLDSGAPGVAVRVDDQRLLQVLANLLSNAVKFSPPGGSVRVSVQSVSDPTAGVRVSVADDGPGVPDNFREQIFGKFAQADGSDSRTKGGTGLGLAISRELVEHMGGRIGFDSVEGEGATFWFELPLARDANGYPSSSEPGSGYGPHVTDP